MITTNSTITIYFLQALQLNLDLSTLYCKRKKKGKVVLTRNYAMKAYRGVAI
jgi:hypothetical protein